MTLKTAGLAAIFLTVGAGASNAATTHVFDLSVAGPVPVSQTLNSFTLASGMPADGGGTLTATFTGMYADTLSHDAGGVITSGAFESADEIERHNNGAGVCRDGSCRRTYHGTGEPHSVDGATPGINDFIEMAFRIGGDLVDVTLTGLTFGWIGEWTVSGYNLGYRGTTGAFEIILDSLDESGDLGIGQGDRISYSGTVTPNLERRRSRGFVDLTGLSPADTTDSIFGIIAGDFGSWKLLSVTVEYNPSSPPPPPPPEIPLPATGWLLVGALAGLAAYRKKSS